MERRPSWHLSMIYLKLHSRYELLKEFALKYEIVLENLPAGAIDVELGRLESGFLLALQCPFGCICPVSRICCYHPTYPFIYIRVLDSIISANSALSRKRDLAVLSPEYSDSLTCSWNMRHNWFSLHQGSLVRLLDMLPFGDLLWIIANRLRSHLCSR